MKIGLIVEESGVNVVNEGNGLHLSIEWIHSL